MIHLRFNKEKFELLPWAISDFEFMFDFDDKFVFIRNESIKYRNFQIASVLVNPCYPTTNIDSQKHAIKCNVFMSLNHRSVLYIPSRYCNSIGIKEIEIIQEIPKAEKYPPILCTCANYDKIHEKYEKMKEAKELAEAKRKEELKAKKDEFEWKKGDAQWDYDMEIRDHFRKDLTELLEKYDLSFKAEYSIDEEAYNTYVMYHGFPVDELDDCTIIDY